MDSAEKWILGISEGDSVRLRRDSDGSADAHHGWVHGNSQTQKCGVFEADHRIDGACDERGSAEMLERRLLVAFAETDQSA